MALLKNLPEEELPREKALKYGLDTLSNRELLALLIHCGTRGRSVLEVADDLLSAAGGIRGIGKMSTADLSTIKGISSARALEIASALELGRRISQAESEEADVICSPESMYTWLRMKLGNEKQERFLAVCLDGANHIIGEKTLFIGTATEAIVSPRDIFREALRNGAVRLMLVHNHPSGTLVPSDADIALTERLLDCGRIMGIVILDHLIVTADGVLSIRSTGVIEEELWECSGR